MSEHIIIVDYGMGNLRSIQHKLMAAGLAADISADPGEVGRADVLILPGVGHFAKGMENLDRSGLRPVLEDKVLGQKTPLFGICLGMQLMTEFSEEGHVAGLGWIRGRTVRFRTERMAGPLKVPHVGWNEVAPRQPSPLFRGLRPGQLFYFTHSYHVECADAADVLATSVYGYEFTSAVHHENIFGVQFHPEKSHREGMGLFLRFVALRAAQEQGPC